MKRYSIIISAALALMAGCTGIPDASTESDYSPSIFPDYTDVVIPSNIAPLNFRIEEKGQKFVTVLTGGTEKVVINR